MSVSPWPWPVPDETGYARGFDPIFAPGAIGGQIVNDRLHHCQATVHCGGRGETGALDPASRRWIERAFPSIVEGDY